MSSKKHPHKGPRRIPISAAQDIISKSQDTLLRQFKDIVRIGVESGMVSEISAELENDPEFAKGYQQFWQGTPMDETLAKAVGGNVKGGYSEELERLVTNLLSMQIDPDMVREYSDIYTFRHERIKPNILRKAGNSTPARLIKSYRFYQLFEFGEISDGKRPGFNLVFKDDDYTPTEAESKKIREFERILSERFFFIPNETRPNFSKWLTYAYNDYFDLDKIAIEIVRQNASTSRKFGYRGKPLAFCLVDGALIHHILPAQQTQRIDKWRWDGSEYYNTLYKLGIDNEYIDEYRYIQVDKNGIRRAVYTEDQMILSHAFGTTDVTEQFSGLSIVEQGLEILKYIMDNIIYNYTRRSVGAMPKGFIHVEGGTEDGMSRKELALFRKMVYAVASGRKDHWKYPIIGTPKGVKSNFVRFHESSREMEDFLWMSTLYSILCGFAGLNPEAVSLASQKNTLGKQRLFDKTQEEGAEYRSQDEGLRFFLHYISQIINSSGVIEELTGMEVKLQFTGLDVKDEAKKADLDLKKLQGDMTMNELLTSKDKQEQELKIGDYNLWDIPGIANPQIQSLIIQAIQSQQQEAQEEEGGMYGEDNEPFSGYPDDNDEEDYQNKDYVGGESFEDEQAGKAKKSEILIRIK